MKNYLLDQSKKFSVALDYGNPSMDFFTAKMKIIQYIKDQMDEKSSNELFESSFFLDIIEQWAYAADRLSLLGGFVSLDEVQSVEDLLKEGRVLSKNHGWLHPLSGGSSFKVPSVGSSVVVAHGRYYVALSK